MRLQKTNPYGAYACHKNGYLPFKEKGKRIYGDGEVEISVTSQRHK